MATTQKCLWRFPALAIKYHADAVYSINRDNYNLKRCHINKINSLVQCNPSSSSTFQVPCFNIVSQKFCNIFIIVVIINQALLLIAIFVRSILTAS